MKLNEILKIYFFIPSKIFDNQLINLNIKILFGIGTNSKIPSFDINIIIQENNYLN